MNLPDRPERAMSLRPRLNLTMLQYQDAPPRPAVHEEPPKILHPRGVKTKPGPKAKPPGARKYQRRMEGPPTGGTANSAVLRKILDKMTKKTRANLDKVLAQHPIFVRSQVKKILEFSTSGSKQALASWELRGWIVKTGRLVKRETEWKAVDGGT
jgi:hypothetical protein